MKIPGMAVSFIAWVVLSLWSRSLRVRFVNRDIVDRFASQGRCVIYAFWHGSVFLLPYPNRDSGIVIMVSESRDGEIAAAMLRHFGLEVVSGSSKRRGDRGLLGLVRAMQKGKSVAITLDGPRGPLHEAKEGAIFLAARMQAPIIPVATGAKHCWILQTWDKFLIPKPFTEGAVLYGEPIEVNGTSQEEIDLKRRELESSLLRLSGEAAALMGTPKKGHARTPGRKLLLFSRHRTRTACGEMQHDRKCSSRH